MKAEFQASFYVRLTVPDCIKAVIEVSDGDGIVEINVTFFTSFP